MVKGTVRQSPDQLSTTVSKDDKASVLCVGAGFYEILKEEECTFEYSTNRDFLRKTIYSQIGPSASKIVGQEMYRYVTKSDGKDTIKEVKGIWKKHWIGKVKDVDVYECWDNQGNATGWCKTLTKGVNSDGKSVKWVRYYRRVEKK